MSITADSALAPPRAPSSMYKKPVVAATVGRMLEWYDFAIYGCFAVVISRLFFPIGVRGDVLASQRLNVRGGLRQRQARNVALVHPKVHHSAPRLPYDQLRGEPFDPLRVPLSGAVFVRTVSITSMRDCKVSPRASELIAQGISNLSAARATSQVIGSAASMLSRALTRSGLTWTELHLASTINMAVDSEYHLISPAFSARHASSKDPQDIAADVL